LVGTLDDKFHISWRVRIFIQLLVSIGSVYFLDLSPSGSFLSFVFYTIFLVGIINSINLIDISDGLSTTISISTIIFLLSINILFNNNNIIIVLIAGLIGALLYFLFLNLPPAKMYMGDGGSNCLGHILGVIAFFSFNHLNWVTGTLSTVLVLIVPLFDTLFVMALRLSKRKNPFEGSPDHFAVRMRLNGYSSIFILMSALVFSIVGGFFAILILAKSSPIFSAVLSTIIFSSLLLVAFILFKAFPIDSDRTAFLRGVEHDA
jgi:UDP-GlcNAc:undecaprenyl-phosphate GlcNAc-1-phosphate transferase